MTATFVHCPLNQLARLTANNNFQDLENNQQKFENLIKQLKITAQAIKNNGGVVWLNTQSCQQQTGLNSPFITALITAYRKVAGNKDDLTQGNIKSETESPESELIRIDKYINYQALSKSIRISFNDRILARTWGNYLKNDLYLCDQYSIEESLKENWKFELVIGNIQQTEAQILSEMINFGIAPGINREMATIRELRGHIDLKTLS